MGTFRALTRFLLVAALGAMAGCVRLAVPPRTAPPSPVKVTWVYRDASRLAMTLQVQREIPAGYHLAFPGCPVTEVKVQSGENVVTLYRRPESGREWLALLERARWDCRPLGEAVYLVNLTWLLPPVAQVPPPNDSALVTVSLGALQVDADDGGLPLSLPAQGDLSLTVDFPPPDAALSWTEPVTLHKEGVTVILQNVFANPTVTWLDACLTYPDRHIWQPEAFIRENGAAAAAFAQGMPLVPADAWDTPAAAVASTRCFTFALPFAFPEEAGAQVSVGVARLRIVPNAGTLRTEECEAARRKVETEYPGLEIRCRAYDIQGEAQHWFEVAALPPGLSPAEARRRMEDALQSEITGPWEKTISVRSAPPSR